MIDRTDAFKMVQDALGGRISEKGESWTTCPQCGKDARHFSFSERGFKCFVCDYKGSIFSLARELNLLDGDPDSYEYERRMPAPPKPYVPPPWVAWGIESYLKHPKRISEWQKYKPLTAETIERFCLGYGPMPYQDEQGTWRMGRMPWLIVPVFEDGRLVALRGRNTDLTNSRRDPNYKKWKMAKGSVGALFNVDNVRPGHEAYITENYIDALLLMQAAPDFDAVAIGGATTWKYQWGMRLAQRKPGLVTVVLDNDLAGQATGATYERLAAEWRASKPGIPVMQPNGPKILGDLQRLGLQAKLWRWKDTDPPKYDLGQYLLDDLQKAA